MKVRLWDKRYQVLSALLLIVVLAESGILFLVPRQAGTQVSPPSPSGIPLPPDSTLVRTEDVITDHLQVWYYTIPHFSEDAVLAYYRSRLSRQGWRCFTSMGSINNEQNGQPLSGSGMYITAMRDHTRLQINSGSMAYGESILGSLLEPMLDPGAVALKVSLEPVETTICS
jgi:hypothetical protein